MTPPRVWQRGERVTLGYGDREITARVVLASGNGQSIMLGFDALIGGYAGNMPILWNEAAGEFRCLIRDKPVLLHDPSSDRRSAIVEKTPADDVARGAISSETWERMRHGR